MRRPRKLCPARSRSGAAVRRVAAALLLGVVSLAAPLRAQPADPAASTVRIRAGIAVAGTGDQVNCTTAPSAVAGIDLRTPGRAFLAVSGDLHLGLPIACGDVLRIVDYGDGRHAEDDGGALFLLAPRLGLRAGYEVGLGRLRLDPSVGAGLVLSTPQDDGPATFRPWASGAVGIALPRSRWGLHLEAGAHAVPVTHEIYSGTAWQETRRFHRWEPLVQLTLRRGL